MTENRLIDISESAARISIRRRQLLIEHGDEESTLPLDEISAVSISNPAVTITQPALTALAESCVPLIVCDSRHTPSGLMLPVVGHTTQTEKFAAQASASLPTKKRLWQSVVKGKIEAQAKVLKQLRGDDFGLGKLAGKVKSGDENNIEGYAARLYWPEVFDDPSFTRDRDLPDQNRFLNYGYAVLRAITGRAICSVGLHPSLGLHHHNRYDSFCLASDLMEPFRPIIDRAVALLVDEFGPKSEFTTEVKTKLLDSLTGRVKMKGELRTIFESTTRLASSLANVFMGTAKSLIIPEL